MPSVKIFDGKFSVTDCGQIYRHTRYNSAGRRLPGRWLKGGPTGSGYRGVCLLGKTRSLHRLVFEAFNGKIPNGMEVDHINMDKEDNSLSNLRLATRSQNVAHKGSKGYYRCSKSAKKPWVAQLYISGKQTRIGGFATKQEAIEAYNMAAEKEYGEFAVLSTG